jgi:hypothetical protein
MVHVCGRGKLLTGVWWGNLREENYLQDEGVHGRIILKWIFKIQNVAWIELIWLRIGTSGRPLETR